MADEEIFRHLEVGVPLWRGMEHIPDAVVIVDGSGQIVYANPQVEPMFGWNRRELLGRPVDVLVPERFRASHAGHLAAYFAAPRLRPMGVELELFGCRRDGSEFPAEISLSPLEGQLGTLVIATIRDVTLRKRTEAEMDRARAEKERFLALGQEQSVRLRAVLENIVAGVCMFDREDRCAVLNRSFARLVARQQSDLLGKTREQVQAMLAGFFRDGDLLSASEPEGIRNVISRGERPRYFWLQWRPVVTGEGLVLGRIFTFRDVTRETEVERMKSEFIATVSHELRTPMTAVKGALGLLLGGAAGAVTEEQQELLAIARNNAERLIRLINDILDLSAVESGRLKLRPMPIDVNAAVRAAAVGLDNVRQERQIQLRTDLHPDLPLVSADPDRIGQVLVNLLDNAYKFTEPGGQVSVQTELAGGEVRVRVSDTGPGIPEGELESIFERFRRASSGAASKAKGTGLGLSIARTIIQEHKGRLWAESEPGKGATFIFTLPVLPSPG